jgi:Uma2 family endonuclease
MAENEASRTKLLTAEEFLMLPGDDRRELVNGEVIELTPVNFGHGDIAAEVADHLKAFVQQHQLGRVVVEVGFTLRRNPDTVRAPDVAFVETARVPVGRARRKFVEGAPTLAVEIVSPGDLWSEVEDKVQLYLEAGARAVWIFDPSRQQVTIRNADGTVAVYGESDTLPGDPVLPGFALPLNEVFA